MRHTLNLVPRSLAIVTVLITGSLLGTAQSVGAQGTSTLVGASQRISSMKVSGECLENREYPDEIVMEEKYDPSCQARVVLTGSTQRTLSLQWWNDEDMTWVEMTRKKTVRGKATIAIDPRTCGATKDQYCDGTFEFRVFVLASTKPRLGALKSRAFDVMFISLTGGEDECDPSFEDCE